MQVHSILVLLVRLLYKRQCPAESRTCGGVSSSARRPINVTLHASACMGPVVTVDFWPSVHTSLSRTSAEPDGSGYHRTAGVQWGHNGVPVHSSDSHVSLDSFQKNLCARCVSSPADRHSALSQVQLLVAVIENNVALRLFRFLPAVPRPRKAVWKMEDRCQPTPSLLVGPPARFLLKFTWKSENTLKIHVMVTIAQATTYTRYSQWVCLVFNGGRRERARSTGRGRSPCLGPDSDVPRIDANLSVLELNWDQPLTLTDVGSIQTRGPPGIGYQTSWGPRTAVSGSWKKSFMNSIFFC